MSKYDALHGFLTRRSEAITLALDELDLMVPGGLPRSAFEHEAWWDNDHAHPQSRSWGDAGFCAQVDLARGQVRFAPSRPNRATRAARSWPHAV